MSAETKASPAENDEISLVDLLVVLIRRRKVLIFSLLLGLASAIAFVVFKDGLHRSESLVIASVEALLYDPAVSVSGEMLKTLARLDSVQLASKQAARSAGAIRAGVFSIRYEEKSNLVSATAEADTLVSASAAVQAGLEEFVRQYGNLQARRVGVLKTDASKGIPEIMVGDDLVPFDFKPLGPPRENAVDRAGNRSKAILVFLGFVFCGVLAAFLVESIARIRKDPDSSKKIRDAWILK